MIRITTNAKDVLRSIQEYKQKVLLGRFKEFLERLEAAGHAVAEMELSKAQYDGDNDVVINAPEWVDDNTLLLSATGNAVTFIEFGTGTHRYPEQHEWASKMGFTRGDYGHKLGRLEHWRYQGSPGTNGEPDPTHPGWIVTYGNPPNRFMYNADKKMREDALRIAREVFGK